MALVVIPGLTRNPLNQEVYNMDVMSIARLSTAMEHSNVMREVGVSVLRNAMDHVEQTGEMMAQMLQSAVVPPAGFDGTGALLDIMV